MIIVMHSNSLDFGFGRGPKHKLPLGVPFKGQDVIWVCHVSVFSYKFECVVHGL